MSKMANSDASVQAMDSSHVSLVALVLNSEGFEHYRCDRSMSLGLNLASIAKVLKCAGNDDSVTLKGEDDSDTVSFVFENEGIEMRKAYNKTKAITVLCRQGQGLRLRREDHDDR